MTPGPNLQELIATVRAHADSEDVLDRLAEASRVVSQLEEVGDAVLAHFVDQCRRGGRSWSEISGALGVSKQAAHKRFSFPPPTFTTERARSALRAAAEAARELGQNYVGTEHVLLGLFEPAGGIAAQVLETAGITRASIEEQVLLVTPRTSSTVTDPPLTPRAAASIERATSEALSLGHNYVGTEHILLALFGDPESLAATILTNVGAQHDTFRSQVIQRLSGFSKPKH